MKLVLAVLLTGVATSYAQPSVPHPNTRVRAGPRVGINRTSFVGDGVRDLFSPDTRTGFQAGGFAMVEFTDYVGFEAGLCYTQKGAPFTVFLPEDVAVEYDYIQFAMLPIGRAPIGESVRLRGLLGPTVSANVRTKGEVVGGGSVNLLDFGLMLGAGIEVVTSAGAFVFDARYELGLRTVYECTSDQCHHDVRNEVFMIGGGFAL